jgi:hypothetical protein
MRGQFTTVRTEFDSWQRQEFFSEYIWHPPILLSNNECPRLKHPELKTYALLIPYTFFFCIQVNVAKYVAIVNHTSHPHVMHDGTVYNLGMSMSVTGPHYSIIKFPPSCDVGSGGR